MPYIDWFTQEELYAGTVLRDNQQVEDFNLALHTSLNEKDVIANRKTFMNELHHDLNQCVFMNQTHSANIHHVTKQDIGAGCYSTKDAIFDCDAIYTREKNILLGCFTADCVPILLYDKEQGIIAAIHSGWQGSVKQILKKMIHTLLYDEDSELKDIYAYIGPSIDFFSYEIGQDVVNEIKKTGMNTDTFLLKNKNGKYLFDNKRMNYQMLIESGVPDLNIFVCDNDTYTNNDDFFSYRRNKDSGRNMTFILRK